MRVGTLETIMSAKDADGAGDTFDCDEYDEVVLTVVGYNSPDMTMKVYGTSNTDEPDFTSSADETNIYAAKYTFDEDSGAGVQGSTGVAFSGTNAIYELKVNTDNLKYVNAKISGYSAGNLTVLARGIRRNR